MLAGAFFGIWATAWSGSWVGRAADGDGRSAACSRSCTRSSRSTCAPTRSCRHGDQLPRARPHRLPLPLHLRARRGRPSDISRIPDVHLAFIEDIPFIGDVFGQLNLMIWLMFALARRVLGRDLQDADRAAAARRSASTRARRTPSASPSTASATRRRPLGDARRARRRLPLDRLHRHVQREHERAAAASSRSPRSSSASGTRSARSARASCSASRARSRSRSSARPTSRRTSSRRSRTSSRSSRSSA